MSQKTDAKDSYKPCPIPAHIRVRPQTGIEPSSVQVPLAQHADDEEPSYEVISAQVVIVTPLSTEHVRQREDEP